VKFVCYDRRVFENEELNVRPPDDLSHRSYPESRSEFLRCQLGQHVHETRRILIRSSHGRVIAHTILVTLFQLIGFGRTWEAAKETALKRLGLVIEPGLTTILTGD
jgi:hypothetical protein